MPPCRATCAEDDGARRVNTSYRRDTNSWDLTVDYRLHTRLYGCKGRQHQSRQYQNAIRAHTHTHTHTRATHASTLQHIQHIESLASPMGLSHTSTYPSACRKHTVKHICPQADTYNKVRGHTNTHDVTWFIGGESLATVAYNSPE